MRKQWSVASGRWSGKIVKSPPLTKGESGGFVLPLTFCLLLASSPAFALDLHGFLQANYSARVTDYGPPQANGSDYLLSEERFQLKLSESSKDGSASFFLKTDFFHDGVDNTDDIEVREGYIDYTKEAVDLRLGRQIITWGTGDLIFINDVFPKDYGAFFSGRPMEYLKGAVDGLKIGLTSDILSAELVAIPEFEANRYPSSERFYLYDPFPSVTNRNTEMPGDKIGDTELAARLFRYFGSTDVSLYAYKGFYRAPGARADSMTAPTTITYFYPALAVYGASASGSILGGIGNIEAGYYDSRDDADGSDPTIENSKWKFLAGYRKDMGDDFTVGVQYYSEIMNNYSSYEGSLPPGSPKEGRVRDYATMRLTKMLMYQNLRLSLFGIYSPSDKDYLVNPEGSYKLSDELSITLGSNVFGGEEDFTQFGQLDKNDSVYTNLRYEF